MRWPSQLMTEALRFTVVGGIGYGIEVATFNALRLSDLGILSGPLLAKTAGMVIATVATWIGSRYWTFRHRRRSDSAREFGQFALVALGGYAVNVIILFFSHYILGLTSLLADNISGNLIGVGFATVFRFLLYRWWVYRPQPA